MSPLHTLSKLLERNLASLASPLAQLVYLSSLRDNYTGRYIHEGWETMTSSEEIHATIGQVHSEIFSRVVQFRLAPLSRELQEHFGTLGGPVGKMAEFWRQFEPFREMLPLDCSPVLKEFFISQMKVALGILGISPDLSALQEPTA